MKIKNLEVILPSIDTANTLAMIVQPLQSLVEQLKDNSKELEAELMK